MDWGSPEFVIAIIALSTGGWIINNWIRAKHGYELEDEWGGKTKRADSQETTKLRDENRALHSQVDKMTDRLVVLEKIVTDRGYDVATQIEALRDQRTTDQRADDGDAGVALNVAKKEKI